MPENRKRPIALKLRVTKQEHEAIAKKMEQLGMKNQEAYLRKMALDGRVVQTDVSGVNALVSLMRYAGNNLNQLTKKAHETNSIALDGILALQKEFDGIWQGLNQLIRTLAEID